MFKSGIYIHIPFCARKCPYCDFYSTKYDEISAESYVNAIINQIKTAPKAEANTIYFGGGTPSLMSTAQIERILTAISGHFSVDENCEISLEMNPATCSRQKLSDLNNVGINRLSIGVQSTDDSVLKKIGRLHNKQEAISTIELAHKCGFNNISADVMLALPGDSKSTLSTTLSDICNLPITHISAYLLKVMDGTEFAKHLPNGIPDDDQQADLYLLCCDALDAHGFSQYEISNFARKDCHKSKHNLKYWDCEPYFGLGAAAHSSIDSKLYSFKRDITSYISQFGSSEFNSDSSKCFSDHLNFETNLQVEDYIMLKLRTNDGISPEYLMQRYGFSFNIDALSHINSFIKAELMLNKGERISLTRKGMLVSNSIITRII